MNNTEILLQVSKEEGPELNTDETNTWTKTSNKFIR
jgi:hypothetical protein